MSTLERSLLIIISLILCSALSVLFIGKTKLFYTESQNTLGQKFIKFLPLISVTLLAGLIITINIHYKRKDAALIQSYDSIKTKIDTINIKGPSIVLHEGSFNADVTTAGQLYLHKERAHNMDTFSNISKIAIENNSKKINQLDQNKQKIEHLISGTQNQQLYTGNSALNLDSLRALYTEYDNKISLLKSANLQYSTYSQFIDSAKHLISK